MLQGTANHGIETILVPTDFSPASAIALEYALAIAKLMRSSITVYHSYEVMAGLAFEDYDESTKQRTASTQKELEEQLSFFVQAYQNTTYKLGGGTVVVNTLVRLGSITKEISKMTANDGYDLVVMGTKGASGVNEVMFGSVASSIVEVVKCPMLVVPEKAFLTDIDLIAYGTNFEKADTMVIDELLEWAGYFNHAKIDCLHINTNASQTISKQQKMEELAKQYQNTSNLHFSLLEDNSVTKGLDNYMAGKQPDIMAVLRREKTFLEKLFKTSVSKQLTFHSKVPVLILKTTKG